MVKKYELDYVANAVKEVLSHYRMLDTYELGKRLRELGIDYQHRTLLKKLQRIEQEYSFLSAYWSNGYIWFLVNQRNDNILSSILAEEYNIVFNKWLSADASSNDMIIYSSQLD